MTPYSSYIAKGQAIQMGSPPSDSLFVRRRSKRGRQKGFVAKFSEIVVTFYLVTMVECIYLYQTLRKYFQPMSSTKSCRHRIPPCPQLHPHEPMCMHLFNLPPENGCLLSILALLQTSTICPTHVFSVPVCMLQSPLKQISFSIALLRCDALWAFTA